MEIFKNPKALRQHLMDRRANQEKIAFVPTMGNLHAGHLSLVRHGLEKADTIVVSIFVNPMQFGAGEDLESYPRTLDDDIKLLEAEGAQVVFTPDADTLYPDGLTQHTKVAVPELADNLCGQRRAGHFDGVTTIVCKLLNLVHPDIALFGEKDLQQLLVIRKMVEDLAMPVQIQGVATYRAEDGLALSSRNGYLSPSQRALAPEIYRSLLEIGEAIRGGATDFLQLCRAAADRLEQQGFDVEYLEARRCQDLSAAQPGDEDITIFIAAILGETRLIDNLQINRY